MLRKTTFGIIVSFFTIFLMSCGNEDENSPSSCVPSVEEVVRELAFYQKVFSGRGFDSEFQRAKERLEQDGIPANPLLVAAISVESVDKPKEQLIHLVFVSPEASIDEICISATAASDTEDDQNQWCFEVINQGVFVTQRNSVGYLAQPLELYEGDNVTSVNQDTVVSLEWGRNTNFEVENEKATQMVVLMPQRVASSADLCVSILDSRRRRSNNVKIKEWIRSADD